MRGPYPDPGDKPKPTRKFPVSDVPKIIRKVDKPKTEPGKPDKSRKF
jgi:hypothetical protein